MSLALVDIQMPKMDGFRLAECIQAIEKAHNGLDSTSCPIVAITAHYSPEIEEKALKVGISRVLKKPVGQNDLQSIVKQYYFGG